MIAHKWTARPYRESDKKSIFELTNAVFPNREYSYESWLRRWHWFYRENPAGNGVIVVADHDGRIVGHSACVPIRVKIGDTIERTRLGSDAMTHPEYRRQGILTTLAKLKFEELERNGMYINYDFAGKGQAASVFAKSFGAETICSAKVLVRPFNWKAVIDSRIKNQVLARISAIGGSTLQKVFYRPLKPRALEGLIIHKVGSFDERVNGFWDKVSSDYEIMVVKNQEYLNWRYVTIPDIDYSIYTAEKGGEIYGYIVFRTIQQDTLRLTIVFNILALSPYAAQRLIAKAVEESLKEGSDLIYCSIVAGKKYLSSFRNNGFISVPNAGQGLKIQSSHPDIPKEFLYNPKNWFLFLGDSDFF